MGGRPSRVRRAEGGGAVEDPEAGAEEARGSVGEGRAGAQPATWSVVGGAEGPPEARVAAKLGKQVSSKVTKVALAS